MLTNTQRFNAQVDALIELAPDLDIEKTLRALKADVLERYPEAPTEAEAA